MNATAMLLRRGFVVARFAKSGLSATTRRARAAPARVAVGGATSATASSASSSETAIAIATATATARRAYTRGVKPGRGDEQTTRAARGVGHFTAEDEAALEMEAERPTRFAQQVRLVQWYPGHIAKAERALREQLRGVDAVVEVRDLRIPLATTHPEIPNWIGGKLRVLVLNRADMVSDGERQRWVAWFKKNGEKHVVLTDAKSGKGVNRVKEVALLVSEEVNAKRAAKGLMPRPVRTAIIGYPNVGKSALINRLTNSKACASAPRPGVTRNLRWVRVGGDLDLLDSPGVLPPRLADQAAAARLAMANDIGEASYLSSNVAAQLFDEMKTLPQWVGRHVGGNGKKKGAPSSVSGGGLKETTRKRFKLDAIPDAMTGEDFVIAVAEKMSSDDLERAGTRILIDFRSGALGAFCLEPAPRKGDDYADASEMGKPKRVVMDAPTEVKLGHGYYDARDEVELRELGADVDRN